MPIVSPSLALSDKLYTSSMLNAVGTPSPTLFSMFSLNSHPRQFLPHLYSSFLASSSR